MHDSTIDDELCSQVIITLATTDLSIYYRDNLYKKMKMTDSNSIQYAKQKTNLITYNYILRKSIHIVKNNYYETLFIKFKDDIKSTWKTINDIKQNKKKEKHNLSVKECQ